MCNTATVNEFILQSFPIGQLSHCVLLIILLTYMLTIVMTCHKLHTAMYFFLSNLPFLEIWYTTAMVPKVLETFVAAFFHFFLGSTEFFILALMSFDHYLAICKSLLYATIMTSKVCLQLSIGAWFRGFMSIFFQTILVFQLPLCDSNIINYFYCDIGSILKIACTDIHLMEFLGFLAVITVILSSLMAPEGIFYLRFISDCSLDTLGAVLFMHLRLNVHSSFSLNKAVSVLNTIFIPLLNPLIYMIRKKEVKAAFWNARASKH
uniref:G-protein coupled receptors family 1 profile domain-containing protein n=1 Tax=Gopherus agassizii TaxID=38772 RepID=A0A452J397_9SAUR